MNIKEIIKQPEGRRLEFKEQIPSGSHLSRTVIAFSNDAGGEIFLGVKDELSRISSSIYLAAYFAGNNRIRWRVSKRSLGISDRCPS